MGLRDQRRLYFKAREAAEALPNKEAGDLYAALYDALPGPAPTVATGVLAHGCSPDGKGSDNYDKLRRVVRAYAARAPEHIVNLDPARVFDPELEQQVPTWYEWMILQIGHLFGDRSDGPSCETPDAPCTATAAQCLDFLRHDVRLVRRTVDKKQRWLLEMGFTADKPPVLVWAVPPKHQEGWDDWFESRPGARNNVFGWQPAVHTINLAAFLAHPRVSPKVKDRVLWGHRFIFDTPPPSRRLRNYQSAREGEGQRASGADFDRVAALGYTEGPLPYRPWTVNPLACVIKTEPRYKVRNVVDQTASLVNLHMIRTPCELDDIHELLPHLHRNAWTFFLDETDAFHLLPIWGPHADYLGFVHPVTGEYHRYRSCCFGTSQSPGFQQDFAREILVILNEEGLQFCVEGSREGDYTRCKMAVVYLDDFGGVINADATEWEATLSMYSILCTLAKYGVPIKWEKNAWPSRTNDFTGIGVDTSRGELFLRRERRERYIAEVENLLSGGAGAHVPRMALAEAVGRLQWCSVVVPRSQARLAHCYEARDRLVGSYEALPPSSSAAWEPDVLCVLTAEAAVELRWWVRTLASDPRRQFLWPTIPYGCLWGRRDADKLPAGDDIFREAERLGFSVITTDASGWAGGAWWGPEAMHYAFTPRDLAGPMGTSSNLRELHVVPTAIDRWGPRFRTRLLVVRMDNRAAVGAINRGGSMSAEVRGLLLWLSDLLDQFKLQLIAVYLPGVDNGRADGLSRLRPSRDDQDWRLADEVFDTLSTEWGPYTVDACSDPLGHNKHVELFWSAVDSCLDHDWTGHHAFCNPPFNLIEEVLLHFLTCRSRDETGTTSGVFCLPVWTSHPWWRLLSGAMVAGYYPAGAPLFTSPDWGRATTADPRPRERAYRGPTRWGVIFVLFLPARPFRHFPAHSDIAGRGWLYHPPALPRLRGQVSHDTKLLHELPLGVVRRVCPGPATPDTVPLRRMSPRRLLLDFNSSEGPGDRVSDPGQLPTQAGVSNPRGLDANPPGGRPPPSADSGPSAAAAAPLGPPPTASPAGPPSGRSAARRWRRQQSAAARAGRGVADRRRPE